MLAEGMVRLSRRLIGDYPPEGRAHWAAKAWNREPYEVAPVVGADLRIKKERIGDLVEEYGKDARRLLEFACGTGAHTVVAAGRTNAADITVVDISADALEIVKRKVNDPRLHTVHGDFWTDLDVGTADLVMCINAIHHMGDVKQVLQRLMTYVEPGGVLIGTVLTMDNFHEFQRKVHGSLAHLGRSALFLAHAAVLRATGGRVRWASYRSQLLYADEFEKILRSVAPTVLHVSNTKFISCFAIRC